MKNFIYLILVSSMLIACGDSGGKKKKANGGTIAVTPKTHQSNICDQLLPAQLALTEYNLDRTRVLHDRFYDSQGKSYKYRNLSNNQFNSYHGHRLQGEFIDLYTRKTFQCNRLYAIDDYIEYRYGIPRACADYRYDSYSGRYVHKYQNNVYVNYNQDQRAYVMSDNSHLNCEVRYQNSYYQDQYYYALFYSYQANYQTGYYGNYNFQAGGNGSFTDVLKSTVLFGIGAAIIHNLSR